MRYAVLQPDIILIFQSYDPSATLATLLFAVNAHEQSQNAMPGWIDRTPKSYLGRDYYSFHSPPARRILSVPLLLPAAVREAALATFWL
jgi:hypothetical protein